MAQHITRHEYLYNYISTNTTTQVATGRGTLRAIVVGETAAGAITIEDGISGTTVTLGVLKASIAEGTYIFDTVFSRGLRITTAGASKITVVYSKP